MAGWTNGATRLAEGVTAEDECLQAPAQDSPAHLARTAGQTAAGLGVREEDVSQDV